MLLPLLSHAKKILFNFGTYQEKEETFRIMFKMCDYNLINNGFIDFLYQKYSPNE